MRSYEVSIVGVSPLLLHADNVQWQDLMEEWKLDPANRSKSKAGDDRSPAWRWIGSLHHDGTQVALPTDNLMSCLMLGATSVLVPGGRSGKTFKSQSQSGIVPDEAFWPLEVNGRRIPMEAIEKLREEPSFSAHCQRAKELGFSLNVKRARIGKAKHIRVRPRFDDWSMHGVLTVTDEAITKQVLEQILAAAGQYKGLGDWRPGGPTPGPWGRFRAEVKEVK